MNFYNPYFYTLPQTAPTTNLFGRLASSARGINFGTILNGTQKTLNIINQAIPIIKEASPMMRNAKTMFKIANEFKRMDAPSNATINNVENSKEEIIPSSPSTSGPTFFL